MRDAFDVVVVGAGPAGSVTAQRLAAQGASVLLLERRGFPRDKPCGGALSGRALRELPFSVDPVVEDVFAMFELRLRYGPSCERTTKSPPAVLTQRRRLDAFLAEQAVRAGAEFHDRLGVARVETTRDGVAVDVDGRSILARTVVAADGANGVTARALGLDVATSYGIALEGNLDYDALGSRSARYRGRIVLEIGTVPGGYGWVFPKGEHVNVGVWGWESEGPRLRAHLARLCSERGMAIEELTDLRGHRLPMAALRASTTARGAGLAVGDAAGLVDPVSGDGMYEAFVSARLASNAIADVLAGRAHDVTAYDAAVRERLSPGLALSGATQRALDRFPGLVYRVVSVPFVQHAVEGVFRGDPAWPGARQLLRGGLAALERLPRRRARRAARLAVARLGGGPDQGGAVNRGLIGPLRSPPRCVRASTTSPSRTSSRSRRCRGS